MEWECVVGGLAFFTTGCGGAEWGDAAARCVVGLVLAVELSAAERPLAARQTPVTRPSKISLVL